MDLGSITYHSISPRLLNLLAGVHHRLGQVHARHLHLPPDEAAKTYHISAVHATLAIEGSLLDPHPIAELTGDHAASTRGPEALEAVNTHRVHEMLPGLDPFMDQDLRQAHSVLMHGLSMDAGHYRSGPMEVFYGDPIPLRTAPASGLPMVVQELLAHAEEDDFPPLITSCVIHFGLIYLRPFSAGNGRLARLWQRRLLMRHWPVFSYLPVEAFIHRAEPAYHAALEYADRRGDSGGFIVYLLERIVEALDELLMLPDPVRTGTERVRIHLAIQGDRSFRRKEYMATFPEISTATATRDLQEAVTHDLLAVAGTGRGAVYQLVRGKQFDRPPATGQVLG
jgi:Fic family protein